MGAIGGLFGASGGANGTGYGAPAAADLQRSTGQTEQSYTQNQDALAQQQRLLNAIQAQGGLQNQSNVYGRMGALGATNDALYGQLQGIAAGQGPNPAQAMLNQKTGENVANQAALMAGQRGAGANVGLMARQAAQQGAGLQQQAVGQGATMQANQSLNALGQSAGVLGQGANIAGQQAGLANTMAANQIGATGAVTSANQAEQGNLLNQMGAYNSAQVGSQGSLNSGNAALANTTMQGQQGMIGGLMNVIGGGGVGGGKANGGMIRSYDTGGEIEGFDAPPATAQGLGVNTTMPQMAPVGGGTYSGPPAGSANIASMDTSLGNPQFGQSAPGGGGDAFAKAVLGVNTTMPQIQGPASSFGQFISGVKDNGPAPTAPINMTPDSGAGALFAGVSSFSPGAKMEQAEGMMKSAGPAAALLGKGGMVDVMLSPGEKVVPPEKVTKAAGGKVEAKRVPGKAKVSGDSTKNDTYKTKLPVGSIVVPRTKSKDSKDSAAFVRKTLAKRGKK